MTVRLWMLGLAALPLVACRAKEGSMAPYRDVHGWTIAEIEAELAQNDQVLAGEGIVVAMATPTVAPPPSGGEITGEEPAPTPEPEPMTEPEPEPDEPSEDDGDGAEPDPTLVGPEATPPIPTSRQPETRPAYESELLAGESAAPDAPAERRRATKRRLARARRDADSRCERLCRLAEATCELETQICELAASHPGESRYQQACLRAEQQCVAASDACQRCEDC